MEGFKKHRGLKRYYKDLAIKNDFDKIVDLELDRPETWFDNWHLHFDWKGYGNNSFKRRKPHLDKLFRHFNILVERTKNLKIDFQLYAILFDYESESDALFLHIASPDNSQFPFEISDLKLTTTLKNKALNDYVEHLVEYEKMYGSAAEEAFCLLFKKNIGQSF